MWNCSILLRRWCPPQGTFGPWNPDPFPTLLARLTSCNYEKGALLIFSLLHRDCVFARLCFRKLRTQRGHVLWFLPSHPSVRVTDKKAVFVLPELLTQHIIWFFGLRFLGVFFRLPKHICFFLNFLLDTSVIN